MHKNTLLMYGVVNFWENVFFFFQQPEEAPSLAVSTEPSVIVSESDSVKIASQVPQMLQETDVSSPSIKQNSVPPPQSKYVSTIPWSGFRVWLSVLFCWFFFP